MSIKVSQENKDFELPKNVVDMGQIIVATNFENLLKVQ